MSLIDAVAEIVAGEVAQQVKANARDNFAGDYESEIAPEYYTQIYEACYDYLTGSATIMVQRNIVRRSIANMFPDAFYAGYIDGGGEETEDEDEAWLTGRMNAELSFADDLFASLRDKRADGPLARFDADAEASTRADGYRKTLSSVYNEGKLRGVGNKMLTWRLGNTEKHCVSKDGKMGCAELDGQRHSAKWWIKKGYKPKDAGGDKITCGGWRCDCRWETDDGEEFTL